MEATVIDTSPAFAFMFGSRHIICEQHHNPKLHLHPSMRTHPQTFIDIVFVIAHANDNPRPVPDLMDLFDGQRWADAALGLLLSMGKPCKQLSHMLRNLLLVACLIS